MYKVIASPFGFVSLFDLDKKEVVTWKTRQGKHVSEYIVRTKSTSGCKGPEFNNFDDAIAAFHATEFSVVKPQPASEVPAYDWRKALTEIAEREAQEAAMVSRARACLSRLSYGY